MTSAVVSNLLRMLAASRAAVNAMRAERLAHDADVVAKVQALEAQLLQFVEEQSMTVSSATQAARQDGYARGVADGARELMLRLTTIKDSRLVVTDAKTSKTIRTLPPMTRFVALITMGRFIGDTGVSVELTQELMPSDPYIEIVAPKDGSKVDGL